jgi:hypothetical protein
MTAGGKRKGGKRKGAGRPPLNPDDNKESLK